MTRFHAIFLTLASMMCAWGAMAGHSLAESYQTTGYGLMPAIAYPLATLLIILPIVAAILLTSKE